MTRDEYFGGDPILAAEYSEIQTCPKSDSGFHCSCFDINGVCCLCEETNTRND
jgi:hypothetical protein